jgi:phosphoribosylanthranilate isomerase
LLVRTEIKFCGLTRAADAAEAVTLGASYVGVIFASGPRRLSLQEAAEVLADVPMSVRRVGVFAETTVDAIAAAAERLKLGAVQLHGENGDRLLESVRSRFDGEVWSVLRLRDGRLPSVAAEMFTSADAVLLEAHVAGKLGGTGVSLPWERLVDELGPLRTNGDGARLVLAGGLKAENVGEAIRLLRPDVVDVSSGVETAPGIKDHARMRAFRDAVHAST